MTQVSLTRIHRDHTGKVSDKWNSYFELYDELLFLFRDGPVRILEIGVQNGGSLEVWSKLFPNAERIVGCEIEIAAAELTFDDDRIAVVVGDATAPETAADIGALCDGYDIVIDDGSHRSDHIIGAFSRYFPMIRDGGVFIAEDLHCSYREAFQGGIEAPFSSVNFFKRLADLVNMEHWGANLGAERALEYFSETHGVRFDAEALSRVREVRFRNSICAVFKGSNSIGQRQVVGREARVQPNIDSHLDGMDFVPSNETANPFGPGAPRLESAAAAYPLLTSRIEELESRLAKSATLHAEAVARAATVAETVHEVSHRLKMARRRPYQLVRARLEHDALRRLARLPLLPERMSERLARSASKRDPRRNDVGVKESGVRPPEVLCQHRGVLWTLAFHRSGKPRGWFRSVVLSPHGTVRPFARRAFYRKNGNLRPDLARFSSRNPHYFRQIVPVPEFQVTASGGAGADPADVARSIFERQQAELTPDRVKAAMLALARKPLISVVMPVYKTPVEWLQRAVESLQEQFYSNWELCVVDDYSPTGDQRQLLREMAYSDPRIRLEVMPSNGGISAASNRALDMAKGEFIALLDHDDEITPDALLRMVEAINVSPEADFLYSDECKIDDTPTRELFHFVLKPDWSPEILLNSMITGHLTLYRTGLVREIGGFRSAYDFSQDYDLALRMSEVARQIVHVERILYLWRAIEGSAASGGKDYARATNIAALADALERRGIQARASAENQANRVYVAIPEQNSRVSIVIPSDSAPNLRRALDAIRERTVYGNYEVRVVCNSHVAVELEREYRDWPAVRFVHYDKPYNFSDKCNAGAQAAAGDIVVFYNDDVFPIGSDWIERLIEYLWVPGVGATSPQLIYEDGTIQYAGMISGTPGMAGTAFHHVPHGQVDSFLSMNRLVRNVSILSGACCAMRRDLFLQIGGFDPENTPDGHSDLDLSFKVRSAGLRCVYTPYSLLTHVGNHSWNPEDRESKADIFCLKRWGRYVSGDPYFTDTMREVLYTDFTFDHHIHAEQVDPHAHYTGPDILFVSHELTHTGAPHMLLQATRAVKEAGGFPVVVSPADGPLRAAFEREGIAVIIDASVTRDHFLFERFARNFDLAVVNTVALRPTVEQLASTSTLRLLWWLHEGEALATLLADVPKSIWKSTTAVCVSAYARGFLPQNVPSEVLPNGLPDYAGSVEATPATDHADKLVFLLVGTIEPRKGQDVFVRAVLGLSEKVRADCRFVMAGKRWPGSETFWDPLAADIADHPEIEYLGDVPHDEALSLIAGCDVLVSCSRDESFSLVTLEAAQMGKPSILSDRVGIREFLDDECSWTFPSEDVRQLRELMVRAYRDRAQVERMGGAARRIYEERLTDEQFAHRFMALVEKTKTSV